MRKIRWYRVLHVLMDGGFLFFWRGWGCIAGCKAICAAFKQARSRLLAPRQGDGVRLRGVVWLSRSPLNPVCRFAQDDTVGRRTVGQKQTAVSVSFTVLYFMPNKLRITPL